MDASQELSKDGVETKRGGEPWPDVHGPRLQSTFHACAWSPWNQEHVSTQAGLCIWHMYAAIHGVRDSSDSSLRCLITGPDAAVCKADQVEGLLDRFSGQAPADVLLADRYYQDLILHSPQLETTVMLVATRDLPLASLQRYAPPNSTF